MTGMKPGNRYAIESKLLSTDLFNC